MVNGYYLNNELTDFSFVPDDGRRRRSPTGSRAASARAARWRRRSSSRPTASVRLAVGAAGGATIIAQVAKAIIGVIDWRLDARRRRSRCRCSIRPATRVFVEQGTALEAMIPALQRARPQGRSCATPGFKANAIEWTDGRWVGAADPRSEGTSVGE